MEATAALIREFRMHLNALGAHWQTDLMDWLNCKKKHGGLWADCEPRDHQNCGSQVNGLTQFIMKFGLLFDLCPSLGGPICQALLDLCGVLPWNKSPLTPERPTTVILAWASLNQRPQSWMCKGAAIRGKHRFGMKVVSESCRTFQILLNSKSNKQQTGPMNWVAKSFCPV